MTSFWPFTIAVMLASQADSLVKPSSFQTRLLDHEIGAIIHFNMQTFDDKMKVDQVARANKFSPSELNTDQWIEAAKSFGAKYAILTVKHFSGFLLWPSNTYNYSVRHSEWMRGKGDIAAEFIQSCKRNNLDYGFYYSTRNNWFMGVANYPEKKNKKQKKYSRVVKKQLEELLDSNSTYKEPFLLWFDGMKQRSSEKIGSFVKNLTEKTVCLECSEFSGNEGGARLAGNERGEVTLPNWYTVSDGECQRGARGNPNGFQFCPAVCNIVLRNHYWFWEQYTDTRREQTKQLIQKYLTSVGRGCPLILNIAPDRKGLVPSYDMWSYKKLGETVQMLFRDPILQVGRPKFIVGKYRSWYLLHSLKATNGSVLLMEDVGRFGQLVKSYEITYLMESSELIHRENGTTIGHKRIHPFPWQPLNVIEENQERPSIVGIRIKITQLVTNATNIRLQKVSMFDWSNAVAHGLL